MTPGSVATSSATVTNTTNFPLPIKGQVSAFLSNTNLTKLESSIFNSASWFTLVPSDFILQPHESKDVLIKIEPPKNIEPGGHYATIFLEPLIPTEVVSPGSTISLARIGILSFLIVPGDIHESLSLESFDVPPHQSFGPITFNLELKNSGNIHLSPSGELVIKDIFSRPVAKLELPSMTILPTTTTPSELVWDKSLLFGRYTATATIKYGTNHETLISKPHIFWVIPWPIILILIMLLTLVYKIFIVHIDRVKLAIKVLKGKDVHETQSTSQSSRIQSRPHRRAHTSHASSTGSKRR